MDYKPYINNQDIASQGRTTRYKGIKAARQVIKLSDYETKCRRLFEFSQFILYKSKSNMHWISMRQELLQIH